MRGIIQANQRALLKQYLLAIITEQIDRAIVLKQKTLPIDYPEIAGLAERIDAMLARQVSSLRESKHELLQDRTPQVRNIYRRVRDAIREIALLEAYGVSPIYYQSRDVKFLNKLAFKIHQEIGLPIAHPVIGAISTSYYYSFAPTKVILVPLAEPDFLLHLSDIYHEIGHHVLASAPGEARLESIQNGYAEAIARITSYYEEKIRQKKRDTGPPGPLLAMQHAHSRWKDWIDEVFCDLFSLSVLGPAYAWSHLHLTVKTSRNVRQFSLWGRQTHPSDEARMRILLKGLEILGFQESRDRVQELWGEQLDFFSSAIPEYQYAFPEELLEEITYVIVNALKKSRFVIISPTLLRADAQTLNFRSLLNRAWEKFWEDPAKFRAWEKNQLRELRESLSVESGAN